MLLSPKQGKHKVLQGYSPACGSAGPLPPIRMNSYEEDALFFSGKRPLIGGRAHGKVGDSD